MGDTKEYYRELLREEIRKEVRKEYERKEQSLKEKRNWLWEFSKKIVFTVTIIFVVVYLFAMVLMFLYPDSTAIANLIDNITKVFIVTVVSYAVKAGFENITKIKRGGNTDDGSDSSESSDNYSSSDHNSRRD